MATNYQKMELGARSLFLQCNQQAVIDRWELEHNDNFIFFRLFSQPLQLNRKTAEISLADLTGYPMANTINESMIIFDLFTFSSVRPHAKGKWASISGLGGVIGSGHDRTLSHEVDAAKFSGHTETLRNACQCLRGIPASKADVGFAIDVFEDFRVLFQFWDGDEEFPAQIKYLFDENALQYMHYETLWYVMSATINRLEYYFLKQKEMNLIR